MGSKFTLVSGVPNSQGQTLSRASRMSVWRSASLGGLSSSVTRVCNIRFPSSVPRARKHWGLAGVCLPGFGIRPSFLISYELQPSNFTTARNRTGWLFPSAFKVTRVLEGLFKYISLIKENILNQNQTYG